MTDKDELLAKKKQQIEIQEEKSDEPEVDSEVINKAKDLFGDAVNIKD